MCATTKGTTRFFSSFLRSSERPILSQPSWQSGQFGFLGGTATWLYAGVSGEIPACGDVLTMNATRAASVHRRFLFCNAEVLANCNEETSRCSRRLLRLRLRLAGHDGQPITSEQFYSADASDSRLFQKVIGFLRRFVPETNSSTLSPIFENERRSSNGVVAVSISGSQHRRLRRATRSVRQHGSLFLRDRPRSCWQAALTRLIRNCFHDTESRCLVGNELGGSKPAWHRCTTFASRNGSS